MPSASPQSHQGYKAPRGASDIPIVDLDWIFGVGIGIGIGIDPVTGESILAEDDPDSNTDSDPGPDRVTTQCPSRSFPVARAVPGFFSSRSRRATMNST